MEYYKDNHITVYNKDCRNMNDLQGESIQMVCTSPPYWGLRKYAGEQDLIWGGKADCQHNFSLSTLAIQGNNSMVRGKDETDSGNFAIPKFKDTDMRQRKEIVGAFCSLCGAWCGAYGLEPTPEFYVQHTIEILREIRRVLRKDGVVFWNIGDSYYGGGTAGSDKAFSGKQGTERGSLGMVGKPLMNSNILKPKDLCLIPFRVAISAQEDGWWVRSIIIWNKPNPMPESVKDRPTESHEYILMLTKSARYYWDAEAVRETSLDPESFTGRRWRSYSRDDYSKAGLTGEFSDIKPTKDIGATYPNRNLRSVWTFPTQGYPEAHFAVFPEELPERCIKAGSKEGDTILDPFAGSGTTLWVAKTLNRKAVGYELSNEYCQLIIKRNRQQGLI